MVGYENMKKTWNYFSNLLRILQNVLSIVKTINA